MLRAVVLFVLVTLAAAACDGSGAGIVSDAPLEFTGGAVESLPQVDEAGDVADAGTEAALDPLPPPTGTIADYLMLRNFFELECHMYPDVNYCPPGVDAAENGGDNPWGFSAGSLLGLIYHAEIYSGGHKAACYLDDGAVDAGSFVAAEAGGDPTAYLVDTYALFECKGESGSDGSGNAYQAYSIDPGYQATLTTRYHGEDQGGGPDMTDIFQVYVTITGGEPTLLAFNFAAINSVYSRSVLLVNLVEHRFAVKYGIGNASGDYANAIGVGGVDRESGAEHPGHYLTRFTDDFGVDTTRCVNNVGQLLEADEAACAEEGVPVAWDGADAVAEYLGLTAEERTRLAAFLAILADSAPMGADQVPQGTADAETNFPKQID